MRGPLTKMDEDSPLRIPVPVVDIVDAPVDDAPVDDAPTDLQDLLARSGVEGDDKGDDKGGDSRGWRRGGSGVLRRRVQEHVHVHVEIERPQRVPVA